LYQSYFSNGVSSTNEETAGDYIGGLVGYLESSIIEQSFSSANVYALGNNVGGLVGGLSENSIIQDSYATGNVYFEENGGGIVGLMYPFYSDATITNTYSSGTVNGENNAGGLVGVIDYLGGSVTIVSSYWEVESAPITSSGGGEGKTIAQMADFETFEEWDFETIWDNTCDSYGFPTLAWQELSNVSLCPGNSIVSEGVSPVQENAGGSSSSGSSKKSTSAASYVAQTIVVENPDFNKGYRNELRLQDRYQFDATHSSDNKNNTHTLQLNRFNATHADVTIRSEPQRIDLALREDVFVDIDFDGQNDILVRYEGINNSRAVIFVQQLVSEFVVEEVLVPEVIPSKPVQLDVEQVPDSEPSKPFNWWLLVLLLAIVCIVAYIMYIVKTK